MFRPEPIVHESTTLPPASDGWIWLSPAFCYWAECWPDVRRIFDCGKPDALKLLMRIERLFRAVGPLRPVAVALGGTMLNEPDLVGDSAVVVFVDAPYTEMRYYASRGWAGRAHLRSAFRPEWVAACRHCRAAARDLLRQEVTAHVLCWRDRVELQRMRMRDCGDRADNPQPVIYVPGPVIRAAFGA
ncbi:MAG: hypothetical protein ACAI43_14835 [Phycisphaerae bacterium]|nr:hypothetical protein [Tepidisphaeraceae bacterium]